MKSEQVTAWALKELSAEEQAQLEAHLQQDESARQQAAQTKDFCDFLSTHLQDPSLALAVDQREQLQRCASGKNTSADEQGSIASAQAQRTPQAWPYRSKLKNLYAIAATLTLLATGTWILLHDEEAKTAYMTEAAPNPSPAPASEDVRILAEARPQMKVTANKKLLEPQPSQAPAAPREEKKRLEDLAASKAMPSQLGLDADSSAKPETLTLNPTGTTFQGAVAGSGGYVKSGAGSLDLSKAKGEVRFTGDNSYAGGTMVNGGSLATTPMLAAPSTAAAAPSSLGRNRSLSRADAPADYQAAAAAAPALPQLRTRGATTIAGTRSESTATPAAGAAPQSIAATQPGSVRGFGKAISISETGLGDSRGYGDANEPAVRLDIAKPDSDGYSRMAPSQAPSSESYTAIVENTLQDVVRSPLSTFSIDVDTASYANVRRFLNQDSKPPGDAVRLEELINYFPTNEEGPAADAKEPFAVRVEMASCPWQPQHRLARIAIKGRELGKDLKPSNLVFLVDVSGSMNEPNKLPLVQKSLRMLAEKLGENDRVTMVTYAGSSGLVLPPTNGEKKTEILAAIDRLQAGGSTHGSAGIQLAYEQAVASFIKGGVNRVILCTDGDFNVGISNPEKLQHLITEKARSGVFLSVLGYGTGNLKDRTMETLADKGNGNYAYIDSLSEARKVLVEQMGGTLVTIAKDVKIQVEFNPAQVRSYRLIGYENRLLAKEDFNDDTKDAGEIGAGHSVTALYELVPANLPPGVEPPPMVDKLKYQTQPAAPAAPAAEAKPAAALSKEALTVKLRYKEPEGTTSKLMEVAVNDDACDSQAASNEFKFTAAVAGFGLLLRDSSYAGQLKWEQVRQLALEGKGTDALGYRGEFLQLIEKARGLSK